ncbi:MAG TPA: type II CRISPR RNA-guided endonuclease Cas9 [Candidatus Xenobia bacterium]|nr:type II CRISPR RNA-guided endonuclease Cas9 [Candidatus Xenobia bacterium]
MERIWGFDLGTTSVGFAVIDWDEEAGRGKILHQGVRIYPESRTPDKLDPLNQNRRAARLIRRQFRRRRLRRKLLRTALTEAGLLPPFGTAEWDAFMSGGADPYQLRARGLRERLEPFEIGRALYHLSHRRGFLSARRMEERAGLKKAREKEEGPIKEEIKALAGKLEGRTLGEYLASLADERKRNRHISREMVMEEFDRLWDAQATHHPELLTDDLKKRLRGILLYQRPIFWRLQTVGQCWLEPGEPVCARGSWLGQQFRMLQQMNNVRLRFPGQPPRPLDAEERAILLEKLQRQEEMRFGGVRTTLKKLWKGRGLDLKPDVSLETGGETRLLGNAIEAKLAEVFGDAWDTHPARDPLRQELYPRLFAIYNRQVGNKRIELHRLDPFVNDIAPAKARFVEEAQKDFGITGEQAEQLADFEPPTGWLRFSEKAILKLLPHLEQGRGLNETGGALDHAYPGWREKTDQVLERLPSHPKKMPVLRNPSVNRTLNELRKVVNNLLGVYGKPDLIRIELLRELKKTKTERQDIRKRNAANRRSREEAAEALKENGIPVRNEAIEQWLLWKESDETCPYTGRKVSFDALFRRGEFQIEHIFPLSRSLDNGYLNKTLCATDVNRAKGDRTPFEFFRNRPEEWEAVKSRLEKWVEAGKFPAEKMKNFLREDYPEGQEFLEQRQKADTSYTAVEARKFLARLGVPVQVCNGQVTAQLRKAWGLDGILNPETPWRKNRADHRHHALDALAVALATPAFIKRLSDYYAREKRGERPSLPVPWEGFWREAQQKTAAIVVSHRVRRKVSGPLHAQTYYGDTGKEVIEGGIAYRYFVFRKPVEKLSLSEVENIRDPEIRRLVKEHVERHGGDPKKAFGENNYPVLVDKETGEARQIRKVRLLVKRQSKVMLPLRPKPRSHVELNNLHHIAIYDKGDPPHDTVTLYEALRRLRARAPLVQRTNTDGGPLVLSLCPGDVLEVRKPDGAREYLVVRKFNEKGRVFYKPLQMADEPKPEVSFGAARLLRDDIRKVTIDAIGRVRPAND